MYEGGFEHDLKHGHGKYTWASGEEYDGQWVQGKRDTTGAGNATCKYADRS